MKDSSGNVLASGTAQFYSPGTLVAQTVYQDAACSSAYTQPITLNAQGQKTIYCLEPVRMIVKDASAVTIYDDVVNLNRHDAVYITHASFNAGAETTLENVLTEIGTNVGASGKYKESSGATARSYQSWLYAAGVFAKDFGATGDGTTDDTTALQSAITEAQTRGGCNIFLEPGTFKTSAALSITAAGVNIIGAGRRASIIKNSSTTGNAITVDLGSATDSKMALRDFSITASTTSSGKGISVLNGDRVIVDNVAVGLHRTGIDVSATTASVLRNILIESTDDNAAGVGVALGTRCRLISGSEVICGTTNGTGVSSSSSDVRITDSYTSKWATGISLSGSRSAVYNTHVAAPGTTGVALSGAQSIMRGGFVSSGTTGVSLTASACSARDVSIAGPTTGISLGAANTRATSCTVSTTTTGISVGAFAGCVVTDNVCSGNTTDISINASATNLVEHGNSYSTLTDTVLTANNWASARALNLGATVTKATDSTSTPAFTPTPTTCQTYVCDATYNGGGFTLTVNATATTGLVDGQLFSIVLQKNSAGANTCSPAWNSQYQFPSTATTSAAFPFKVWVFRWKASSSKWIVVNEAPNWMTNSSASPY